MNISNSECSSGCESGWTMYFDQSSDSAYHCRKTGAGRIADEDCRGKGANVDEEEEEDEDLSMVSDASSGPPHFLEDEDCFDETGNFCYPSSASERTKKTKQKKKLEEHRGKQHNSYLDDTASSHVLSFSKKNRALSSNQASMEHVLDFSQGYSATHFKGKSAFQEQFGFLQPSGPEKAASGKSGSFQGRKWQ